MRTITDMAGIRALAHTFLLLEPEPTACAPIVVKHPFTDSGIVALRTKGEEIMTADIMKDMAARAKWRELIGKNIDGAQNVYHIYGMLTKSYYFAFLKFARPYLGKEDFSKILGSAWVMAEAPNQDPNFRKAGLLSLFKSADPKALMEPREYERLLALDEVVTVYRGVTPYNADNVKALSWTLDMEKAEWFARRFGQEGCVYRAEIAKEHVLALFLGRGEKEVIVDPGQLRNIKAVQDEKQELVQSMGQ